MPSQHSNPTYTSNNTAWILNELRESAHNLPALLTGTYNYGSLYRRLLPSVEVGAGGHLFINNASLPNSGGVNTANDLKENTFEVYTSSCGSRVQLGQGGRLTLGQPNDTHVGTLRIANNSLLNLRAGSQTTVNAGSVLRVQRGGTLVVRQGAQLAAAGQIIVEEGAYVCVEDPASITTTGGGQYSVAPGALFGTNRVLGLSGLACDPIPLRALLNLAYTTNNGRCVSRTSGRGNYAQWSAAATGGTGRYTYAWELDAGRGFQLTGQTGATFGVCLNDYPNAYYIQARVTVTSGTQQTTAQYYSYQQARLTLYPNPADGYVDVANEAAAPAATTAPQSTPATARGANPAGPGPMQVTVYNAQGKVVFTAANVSTPYVRLPTATWPAGLYQVTVQQDKGMTRHQLSVQH